MALSLDAGTRVFTILQSDLDFVSGTLWDVDTDSLRLQMLDLLDDEDYMYLPNAFTHNTEVAIAGVTYARLIEMINSFSITFENTGSAYAVRFIGSNNNMFDAENNILNVTPLVSYIPTNSAGLQVVSVGSGLSPTEQTQLEEIYTRLGLKLGDAITDTTAGIDSASGDIEITRTGDGTSTSTLTREP